MIPTYVQSFVGLATLIGIAFLLSTSRRAVPWRTVAVCLAMQIVFAIFVLKVPGVVEFFSLLSQFFVKVLDFTRAGAEFLFGQLMNTKSFGFIFAFQVLPTIIFFSALSSLLYYLKVLQWIVYGFAWVFTRSLKISGAESLSTAANIFLGQTEAPLLVKPYLSRMTRSEIFCVMVGGMANIAGGVLAAYVGFLGGEDPVQRQAFATHLLCASIMSAPAALLIAKIMVPPLLTETPDRELKQARVHVGENAIEAITIGTRDGVSLAVNVGAMLLVFTALVAMGNEILGFLGSLIGINAWVADFTSGAEAKLSLQFVLSLVFSPVAWLIGIGPEDMRVAARLLGEKTILNEFYAYASLAKLREAGAFVHPRSMIIVTYALCGFANIASIGIQVGGIGSLAPEIRPTLARLGVRALVGGTLATLMTAAVVSFLL